MAKKVFRWTGFGLLAVLVLAASGTYYYAEHGLPFATTVPIG
jgi:hypothetical protein